MEERCLCEHLAGDRDSIPGSKGSQYPVLTGTVPDERKAQGAWCEQISVCKDTAMGEGESKWCESASNRVLVAIGKILVFFQSKIKATGRF